MDISVRESVMKLLPAQYINKQTKQRQYQSILFSVIEVWIMYCTDYEENGDDLSNSCCLLFLEFAWQIGTLGL